MSGRGPGAASPWPVTARRYAGATMSTYLSAIVGAHRAAAREDRRDISSLMGQARQAPQPAPFAAALADGRARGLSVVAEVKRRSPSKGDLAPDLDPADLAG